MKHKKPFTDEQHIRIHDISIENCKFYQKLTIKIVEDLIKSNELRAEKLKEINKIKRIVKIFKALLTLQIVFLLSTVAYGIGKYGFNQSMPDLVAPILIEILFLMITAGIMFEYKNKL